METFMGIEIHPLEGRGVALLDTGTGLLMPVPVSALADVAEARAFLDWWTDPKGVAPAAIADAAREWQFRRAS